MKLYKLYKKQLEALKLIEKHKYSLLIGQGRSSKTTLMVWYFFLRAWKYPNTSHVIFRNTLSSAIDGIWAQTIKEVITNFYPILPSLDGFKINESSHTITFPNGSRVLLRGLDNPERATKILSQQFATVGFDESMTIDYTYFALLMTRTPQPFDVDYKVKIICTANYAPKTHWNKIFFSDKLNPETKAPHNLDCNFIKFTTEDNKSIDSEEYINTLKSAGDRRARLMCSGEDWYDEIFGALWNQEDIQRTNQLSLEEYDDIVIAFDAAITNTKTSDEHGVTIAGIINEEYHILESFEKKEDVNIMANELAKLYHSYQCSKLIYETNQGADWIPALINNHDSSVYCEGVRAKKNKCLRAEPIAAQYKNKKVFHTRQFKDLEDQMVTYTGIGDSPNSLDSLVYAVKYLSEKSNFVDPNDCI